MAVKMWTGQDANAPARAEDYDITWAGLVVALTEHNFYDDSDFAAVVWDDGTWREVTYATTRGWTYRNSATVDAPAELIAAYAGFRAAQRAAYTASLAAAEAARVDTGKTVEVVKGRKVPVGTTGEVFWTGENKWGVRVGIKDADGEVHWTAASNCQVVELATA